MATRRKSKKAAAAEGAKEEVFISPEWQQACDEIAAAKAWEVVAEKFSPFGQAGPRIASAALKGGQGVTRRWRRAVMAFLPEAIDHFDASHPPCPVRSVECRRLALLEEMACWAYEQDIVPNPTIEFRRMRVMVDRYLKSRS